MQWYIELVTKHPILTAMIQFAILGTLGDMVAKWVQEKRIHMPFSFLMTLWKMVEWAFLAILIKAAFIGYQSFVEGLIAESMLPAIAKEGVFRAFAVSFLMNAQFGFLLVVLHRILDYLPVGKIKWNGINKGFYSLFWFWVPAHTVTFSLSKPYQIGLAAVWSLVLGLILGLFNKK
ncbi:MAG: hypothetical protein RBS16_01020 [Candidatus Cloacimonadales bacterium]|jgi:hypothetical protein|nr:hypothetical protein [Candidatus Cloacimonadota bacterium]MDD2649628.1 hypothetical protein [Candidatus Cloacimonadota bacterium]MDD3501107.1 hypothetical protein [Candidatus Cloacimonadota bacterium]MDX9976594.1 hypothetical protein [Candidatus Cloacimonadales bacterium]